MTITATFENGVLKPDEALNLPDHAQVRLTVELLNATAQKQKNQEALDALEDVWRTCKIHSQEEHLTRDQLHERH